MSLYYQQLGSGPALVLLHGWGMNAAVWEPLLPGLARQCHLTIIELPGHGASEVAVNADLDDWARQCLAVAPPSAHWLGWSLGGQVAIQAALGSPQRVSGLSLLAATPCFVQADDWDCAMPLKTFHAFADALGADANATLLRFLGLQVKGADHARETLKLLRAEIAQRPTVTVEGLQQGLDLLLNNDLRAELSALTCPTHWLFGTRDTLVPPAMAERLVDYLPSAQYEAISGAGHAPFLSHPQESLTAISRAVTTS